MVFNAQAFFTAYRKAEIIVKKYKRDLVEWEQKVKDIEDPDHKRQSDKSNNEQHDPPERESVRDCLRHLQRESRQKPIRDNRGRER